MEWISVEERLPEVKVGGLAVCLISDGRTVTIGEFFIKHIDGWTQERDYSWRAPLSQCSEATLWDSITHWMPLPPAPSRTAQGESDK